MGDVLMVPKGYETYKKRYLKRIARGEVDPLAEEKEPDLFYVS